MDSIIPFDAVDPKSRLGEVLSSTERAGFAEAMLADVLAAFDGTDVTPRVLSTAPMRLDATVIIDERPLSTAVNAALEVADRPIAVVMADLPLLTSQAIDDLLRPTEDVVIAPGIGGGTNAMVIRSDAFTADFHGCSFRDHLDMAARAGLEVAVVDSFRLSLDIDEADDLVEVLLHSDGAARRWLLAHGFDIVEDADGRVSVARDGGD